MILAFPQPWTLNPYPPKYLVAGDKVFYIFDQQSAANLQRVGIPLVPFRTESMDWILARLDPSVEHPLGTYDPDPPPQPIWDGGGPNTPYFLRVIDGDDPDDDDGFIGEEDGGIL